MQIVIDIDDKYKDMISDINPRKGSILNDIILDAAKNGTPLPKGHGRLIDESDLMPDSDYEDGTFYAVSIGQIKRASTIIEADRAESEG